MFSCVICHFEVELDDVVIRHGTDGKVICASCFYLEVGGARHVVAWLRRQVESAMAPA